MGVEIETKEQGETVTLSLAGELDLPAAQSVGSELGRVESRKPQALVLDLRQLEFIDSSGVQLVVSADNRAREAGHRLAVVKGPKQVHRVFETLMLDGKLDMVEDLSGLP